MGGGRETGQDRSGKGQLRITVYPSEVHEYAYCPRHYFFTLYTRPPRGILERLRLLAGRIFHAIHGLGDRVRGYHVEETVEAEVGGVRLRGRPDSYTIEGGELTVVERKSGRRPRRGVWASDAMQATAYTVILGSGRGVRRARIILHYRDGRRVIDVNEDHVAALLRIVDEIALVKGYGLMPATVPGPYKCARCKFREACEAAEAAVSEYRDLLDEPGYWLRNVRVVEAREEPGESSEDKATGRD